MGMAGGRTSQRRLKKEWASLLTTVTRSFYLFLILIKLFLIPILSPWLGGEEILGLLSDSLRRECANNARSFHHQKQLLIDSLNKRDANARAYLRKTKSKRKREAAARDGQYQQADTKLKRKLKSQERCGSGPTININMAGNSHIGGSINQRATSSSSDGSREDERRKAAERETAAERQTAAERDKKGKTNKLAVKR